MNVDGVIQRRGRGAPKGNRNNLKHGLYRMKKALMSLGGHVIDKRYAVGKALAKWRADLVADLGGDVSTQQSAIIDLCVKTKLLLDSIDAWLLVQPSLVNTRKKSLLPAVVQRQTLADALVRHLLALGLARRSRELSLKEILESSDQDQGESTEVPQ